MKILIAEDDFTSRLLLQELLKRQGQTHIATNGKEAVEAARFALETGEPYTLICLDVMMPEMDGQEALRLIREHETSKGILSTNGAKILMTTALGDPANVVKSFSNLCDGYIVKPIEKGLFYRKLQEMGLPLRLPVLPSSRPISPSPGGFALKLAD